MRLTTLGTGTVALTPSRVCAGYLLQAGDISLLMDCGSGVTHRLAEHAPWRAITHVAFTHFHTDHIGDFATLMFAWKYGDLPGRSAPLVVIGPVGITALLGRLADAFGNWLRDPGFPVSVLEVAPGGASLDLGDGVQLGVTKVPHTPESVAYSISRGGRRVVYTGDTGYDPMLAEWARGADLLLCECSLPPEMAIPEHLTPAQCGALAAAALPGHLVLTHFYPPVERTDVRAAVSAHYAGPISLAEDGATFEIEEG
jgi:ribonuclease BN (tRNA processing enzyme)